MTTRRISVLVECDLPRGKEDLEDLDITRLEERIQTLFDRRAAGLHAVVGADWGTIREEEKVK